jgi:spore coat protein U-like protein
VQEDAPVSRRSAWLLFCACLALPPCARAAKCTVSITNVTFAAYDVFKKTKTTSAGKVKVKCNVIDSYTIALSAGFGTFTSRVMESGSYGLDYNLYTNSSHTIIWGDGTSGTSTVSATNLGATYTVYGMIPALQNVPVGSYSDIITVTVTY